MHSPVPAGKVIHWQPVPEERAQYVEVKVGIGTKAGDDAMEQIDQGILTSFSIGAPTAERVLKYEHGKPVKHVVGFTMAELSLVDLGACPGTEFKLIKSGAVGGVGAVIGVSPALTYYLTDEIEKRWKPKTDDQKKWISDKIRTLVNEGKPQDQAIAIAYSMAQDKFDPSSNKEASVNMLETQAQISEGRIEIAKSEKEKAAWAEAEKAKEKERLAKEAADKAELEKRKKIGPQRSTAASPPGPKQPSVETGEQPPAVIPKIGKELECKDPDHGKPGHECKEAKKDVGVERPEGESEPVAAPDTADKAAEADADAAAKEAEAEAARKEAEAMKGARYGYCAMCGQKFAEAQASAYHKNCMENARKAAVSTEAGLAKMIADNNAALEGLLKSGLAKVDAVLEENKKLAAHNAELEKRLKKVEDTPLPGGPKRLPPGTRAVDKTDDGGGPVEKAAGEYSDEEVAALEKVLKNVDPGLRQQIMQQPQLHAIKKALGLVPQSR